MLTAICRNAEKKVVEEMDFHHIEVLNVWMDIELEAFNNFRDIAVILVYDSNGLVFRRNVRCKRAERRLFALCN